MPIGFQLANLLFEFFVPPICLVEVLKLGFQSDLALVSLIQLLGELGNLLEKLL